MKTVLVLAILLRDKRATKEKKSGRRFTPPND